MTILLIISFSQTLYATLKRFDDSLSHWGTSPSLTLSRRVKCLELTFTHESLCFSQPINELVSNGRWFSSDVCAT